MAVTKLLHIKERKKGNPSVGLYQCIKYDLNPEKTENSLWIGGNCGTSTEEIYETMMETKYNYEKLDGRQGYHFMISFRPGEATESQAYQVVKEFCESYLGEDFEYAFGIHNDKDHMHGHICFNSVSRTTGYKYHYANGDWEKIIQPITDRICKQHGLEQLQYEKNRVGRSYGQHLAEKEGRMTWEKIVKRDMDFAMERSKSYEDFLNQMLKQGYQIQRSGMRKDGTEYLTLLAPGAQRGTRTTKLGSGYQVADIKNRILKNIDISSNHKVNRFPQVKQMLINGKLKQNYSRYQVRKIHRLFRAGNYQYLNPYAISSSAVRKDLINIRKLSEEVSMMLKYQIHTKADTEHFLHGIRQQERQLKKIVEMDPAAQPDLQFVRKQKSIARRILKNGFEVGEVPEKVITQEKEVRMIGPRK